MAEEPDQVPTAAELLDFMRVVAGLNRSLLAVGEEIAAAADLSHARSVCLQEIADEPRTVASIAARLDTARQSVQRVADLLVAGGMARYAENPRHRRAKLLTVTPAGRAALDRMSEAHHRWVLAAADNLATADVGDLSGRLRAVQEAVSGTRPAARS
ncbi:MarR family winged helix-turn-helix transcriptional regulator [Pseudonocardia sp. TRM90224]|uniref:MarR family winged helix-turn-helix transcriptional regulator n=1 Tax=Pseudonocardia sp. TRM90224 TaxID=2812678 RepID=UPI001E2F7F5A|nr:MarR family transcriptional regulator [Pseudonocardia sp. TRM90224]